MQEFYIFQKAEYMSGISSRLLAKVFPIESKDDKNVFSPSF